MNMSRIYINRKKYNVRYENNVIIAENKRYGGLTEVHLKTHQIIVIKGVNHAK